MMDESIFDVVAYGVICIVAVVMERVSHYRSRPSKAALDYFSQSDDLNTFELPLQQKYSAFTLGKFQGKIFRKIFVLPDNVLRASKRGQKINDVLLTTTFTVAIPPVQNFYLRIEFPRLKDKKKKGQRDAEADFVSKIVWEIPEPELLAAFQSFAAIEEMRGLARSAAGEIVCRDGEFSIRLLRGLKSDDKLDSFYLISASLFRIYAQVAQLNVPAWRLPENNHDWWHGVSS